MNAAQRRTARRATAAALPLGTKVSTPTGTAAVVFKHLDWRAMVKFRNNAKRIIPAHHLTPAA